MTLEQWTKQIRSELEAAGFAVQEYSGLPLVKRPENFDDGVRLIKLKLSMSCAKKIYAEGMLFVPIEPGCDQVSLSVTHAADEMDSLAKEPKME